jgi:hypothetical protein
MFDELNDDWIQKFDEKDRLYKDFYPEDIYFINFQIIYLNTLNEIEKVKFESFLLSNQNTVTREELIRMIKDHNIENNKKYKLFSLLKFNLDLEIEDLKPFLYDSKPIFHLNTISSIDNITFKPTITMFQDLNEIIIIFQLPSQKNNFTKRIYMHNPSNKKTIKKRYKD